jgi:ABC-type nitrate/sulfonate/bicarbonate transport system permease component
MGPRVLSIVALAAAWEVAARLGAFTPSMLPALSAVLEALGWRLRGRRTRSADHRGNADKAGNA